MDAKELLEGLREFAAWGTIDSDGTVIDAGSGNWSSTKTDKGRYLITVKGSFGGRPAVVASGYRVASAAPSPSQDNFYTSHVLNKEAFEVHSYDAGNSQDGPFSFIAIWRL